MSGIAENELLTKRFPPDGAVTKSAAVPAVSSIPQLVIEIGELEAAAVSVATAL